MSSQPPTTTPHKSYYLMDGITFIVDDTLFRVPRYLLESSSPVLADLISSVKYGETELMPIVLPNITSAEFEHLLTFLYPLNPPTGSPAPFSASQWISILRLSTLFRMTTLNTLAVHLLSTHITDPLTKIRLGREYDYIPWKREGFVRLCLRDEMVSIEEAEDLKKEEIVMCARAREEIRKGLGKVDRGKWRLARGNEVVSPSRATTADRFDDNAGLGLSDREVLLIVDHAFGFPHIEEGLTTEDKTEGGQSQKTAQSQHDSFSGTTFLTWKWDNNNWQVPHWPSDLHFHIPSASRLFYLISPTSNASKEEWKRNIDKLKNGDLPDNASIISVEDMEKYWLCGTLRKDATIAMARDLKKYVTPMSVSVALGIGAVGAFVLIPQLA